MVILYLWSHQTFLLILKYIYILLCGTVKTGFNLACVFTEILEKLNQLN